MKIRNIFISVIFLLWIFGLFVAMIILPDKSFSELENTMLSDMPKISVDSFFTGEFGEDFEKYLNDQFPFREFFKRTSATYQYAIMKKEIGGVLVGEKRLYQPTRMEDRFLLEKNIKALQNIIEKFPNVYVGLIPSSGYLYRDDIPKGAPVLDEGQIIDEVYSSIDGKGCIDIYENLNTSITPNLFYCTDHHWNSTGAYYGYTAIAKAMGIEPIELGENDREVVTDSFYGTSYSRAPIFTIIPDEIFIYAKDLDTKVTIFDGINYKQVSIYNEDKLDKKDKYAYFLGGNQPLIILETKEVEKEKLLVIRDSFFDSVAPYLQTHFSEIHMVDVRYYRKNIMEYIKENEIDKILIMQSVDQFVNIMNIEQIIE